MAQSRIPTMYFNTIIELGSILRVQRLFTRVQCFTTSARLKDEEDRLWLSNRRRPVIFRKKNNIKSPLRLKHQSHISTNLSNASCERLANFHSSVRSYKDDEPDSESKSLTDGEKGEVDAENLEKEKMEDMIQPVSTGIDSTTGKEDVDSEITSYTSHEQGINEITEMNEVVSEHQGSTFGIGDTEIDSEELGSKVSDSSSLFDSHESEVSTFGQQNSVIDSLELGTKDNDFSTVLNSDEGAGDSTVVSQETEHVNQDAEMGSAFDLQETVHGKEDIETNSTIGAKETEFGSQDNEMSSTFDSHETDYQFQDNEMSSTFDSHETDYQFQDNELSSTIGTQETEFGYQYNERNHDNEIISTFDSQETEFHDNELSSTFGSQETEFGNQDNEMSSSAIDFQETEFHDQENEMSTTFNTQDAELSYHDNEIISTFDSHEAGFSYQDNEMSSTFDSHEADTGYQDNGMSSTFDSHEADFSYQDNEMSSTLGSQESDFGYQDNEVSSTFDSHETELGYQDEMSSRFDSQEAVLGYQEDEMSSAFVSQEMESGYEDTEIVSKYDSHEIDIVSPSHPYNAELDSSIILQDTTVVSTAGSQNTKTDTSVKQAKTGTSKAKKSEKKKTAKQMDNLGEEVLDTTYTAENVNSEEGLSKPVVTESKTKKVTKSKTPAKNTVVEVSQDADTAPKTKRKSREKKVKTVDEKSEVKDETVITHDYIVGSSVDSKLLEKEVSDTIKEGDESLDQSTSVKTPKTQRKSRKSKADTIDEKVDVKDQTVLIHDSSVSSLFTIDSESVSLEQEVSDADKDDIEDSHQPAEWSVQKEISAYLEKSDVPFTQSYTGYLFVCPKFGKVAMKRKKEEQQIYINFLNGYFKCKACGKSGNWEQLKSHVESVLSTKSRRKASTECFKGVIIAENMTEKQKAIDQVQSTLAAAQSISSLDPEEFENLLSVFDWQGIKKETFSTYDVKYVHQDNKYTIYFPIVDPTTGLVGARVYTAVITEEEDVKMEPVCSLPTSCEDDMFGWQTKPKSMSKNYYKKLVITSSEIQAMAIRQQTKLAAMSVHNIVNFPRKNVPLLEQFEKIYLWLGTKFETWESSLFMAKNLNDSRCLIFRPSDVKVMPLDCLQTEQDINSILEQARPLSHDKIHTFQDLRLQVYNEYANHDQVKGVQWKRYAKLNNIMKGFRSGELTVVTGPTGSGKTTFLSEYSLDLCSQGVKTLWGSFEISNVRLIKTMMQQLSGIDLSKHLDQFDSAADEFNTIPMFFMAYHGQQNIDEVLETMYHAVYVHNIQHILIDNMQFMVGLEHLDDAINIFRRQDRIVSQFRRFATINNCHVTLIIHPRKVAAGEELSISSIFGGAKVSQEADNIMMIQDNRLTKPGGKKYLQISKNRFDGDLGVIVLTFDKESLSYAMTEKKK